jgi:translation initiation factor 1
VSRDSNTRLAYSTGGEPAQEPEPKKTQRGSQGQRKQASQPAGGHGIRLRLDRRASDRVVTVVTGLPGNAAAVAALARELKASCGAGGTVKDGALELQGDHREKVEQALAARGLKSKRSGG